MDPEIQQRQPVAHELTQSRPDFINAILASRGITKESQLNFGLNQLPDPWLLKDIDLAVERLLTARKLQQPISISGDFDADGATSSAILQLALEAFGFQYVQSFVPNRFDFGYGLTKESIDALLWQKPALIITVDNGISSVKGVEYANQLGIDVIVTDHHLPGEQLPAATAIINPNQKECLFPAKNSAGVAVVFYLMVALRKKLLAVGLLEKNDNVNLAQYLDLVALGTVADVVPLDRFNQILVTQGLKRIRAGQCREGIKSLVKLAKRPMSSLVAQDLGFSVAPRLNAAGRLDDISIGIMLLTTTSKAMAEELALVLDEFNRDRKSIEKNMQQEAVKVLQNLDERLKSPSLDSAAMARGICLYQDDWHQGVVGLVASRLKSQFHRPAIIFAPDLQDGECLKGSARSIEGLHIRDILCEISSRSPGLILKFGGHAMAAGLSIKHKDLADFNQCFQSILDQYPIALFKQYYLTDGQLAVEHCNFHNAKIIGDLLPWGQSLPEPIFEGYFDLISHKVLTGGHIKLKLSYIDSPLLVEAIWFNADVDALEGLSHVCFLFKLKANEYLQKTSVQLQIINLLGENRYSKK